MQITRRSHVGNFQEKMVPMFLTNDSELLVIFSIPESPIRMTTRLFLFASVTFLTTFALAQNIGRKPVISDDEKNHLLNSVQGGFLENTGQLSFENGKAADEVWFQAGARDVDVYLTAKGLTYIFTKYEKEDH